MILQTVLQMIAVRPHEELLAANKLTIYDESKGKALFVSHEWLGNPVVPFTLLSFVLGSPYKVTNPSKGCPHDKMVAGRARWVGKAHPDPEFDQFRIMQDALKNIWAGLSKISVDIVSEAVFGINRAVSAEELQSEPLFIWHPWLLFLHASFV